MGNGARRIVLGMAFGIGGLIAGPGSLPVAAQSCDPAYISHCVPAYAEVGDLNCDDFYAPVMYMIQLANPSNDPHGLDS